MSDDATQKIILDLPEIQRIALRPLARSPLLPLVVELAQALQEIGNWAGAAQKLATEEVPAPVAEAPSEEANGHAAMPTQGDVLTPIKSAGRTRGG